MRRAQPWLGTLVDITLDISQGRSGQEKSSLERQVSSAAFEEIGKIHRLMSVQDPLSDISRVNRTPINEWTKVDPATFEVLEAALWLFGRSGGIFDCTAEKGRTHRRSSNLSIEPAFSLRSESEEVRREKDCRIDVSGIAKGYAMDRATMLIQSAGASYALVDAGGDMRHLGSLPAQVHLRHPLYTDHLTGSVLLHNEALASSATSGYSLGEGVAESAILDARTGKPLPLGIGVSVIAKECMWADALTKIALTVGADICGLKELFEELGARILHEHDLVTRIAA